MGKDDEKVDVKKMTATELAAAYNSSVTEMNDIGDQLDELRSQPAPKDEEGQAQRQAEIDEVEARFWEAVAATDLRQEAMKKKDAIRRATEQFRPVAVADRTRLEVKEPDLYVRGGRSFFHDMYMATMKGLPDAQERINKHQALSIEQRATTSATMGGLIPPQYLLDLYAKAPRNGRVFADQCNGGTLPDTGMSIIVPRITTATAAGVQATENTAVTTQDPVETDLTVNVRTLAGYLPVSRQAIERAAYDDRILFEDLTARYWALLDTQALNGLGSAGTMLGLLQTAGIASSTASTATVAGVYPKIADVIQQINTNMGGIGYVPDKIVMHPRRWGFFDAAVDTTGRPIFGITNQNNFNDVAVGEATGYGGPVGSMLGLPVYTDANIPTNTGAATNQDSIIVMASQVIHLWERGGDPVTLSFEQQAGTSLQVQLIVYGYAAFTAGRYPAAAGAVTGAGLVPPTF